MLEVMYDVNSDEICIKQTYTHSISNVTLILYSHNNITLKSHTF